MGLIISWLALGLINDAFLTPLNLTNLMLQIASLGTLATGICLVLLLGEIDMSAGVVSGLSAALMAALNVRLGVPGPLAVLAGIGAGALVGLFQGLWITRLRIPSFIVTLAGMIGWWGVVLWLLGSTGTIPVRDTFITGIANTFFTSHIVGGLVGVLLVAGYAALLSYDRRQRLTANLSAPSSGVLLLRVLIVAVIVSAALLIFYADRGLPLVVVIFIGLVIIVDGADQAHSVWSPHLRRGRQCRIGPAGRHPR